MHLIQKLIILGVGTICFLAALMTSVIKIRGGISFVYPFHGAVIVVSVVLATVIFHVLVKRFAVLRRHAPVLLTMMYLVIVGIIWLPAVPMADVIATQVEKLLYDEPFAVEAGYGWHYWDDSGMGAEATNPLYAVGALILRPWWTLLLVVHCWLVIRWIRAA